MISLVHDDDELRASVKFAVALNDDELRDTRWGPQSMMMIMMMSQETISEILSL